MSRPPPLRWGLLGTARINRRVIPPLRASARNRLVAVASRDLERARAYAAEWGIERSWGSYEELVADPGIDVVYVPLPNHLHVEWTLRAVRAGKHVLCEKPLALQAEDVDRVATAAREHGVAVAEALMYRHHPQTLRVRELVEEGAVGRVQLVRGSFTFPLTRPGDVRLDPAMGGGCLWDLGCYPVSLARFVLGREPTRVFGQAAWGETGIDETFAGQMEFPGGVLAQIDCGFRAPLRTSFEVVGTEGTIVMPSPWRPDPALPTRLARDETVTEIPVGGEDKYLLEIEDLADAALLGRAPRVSLADTRGNTAALRALLESARSGRPVRLEDGPGAGPEDEPPAAA
jgi:xylose dehydrogenase (NAD/NADP)